MSYTIQFNEIILLHSRLRLRLWQQVRALDRPMTKPWGFDVLNSYIVDKSWLKLKVGRPLYSKTNFCVNNRITVMTPTTLSKAGILARHWCMLYSGVSLLVFIMLPAAQSDTHLIIYQVLVKPRHWAQGWRYSRRLTHRVFLEFTF